MEALVYIRFYSNICSLTTFLIFLLIYSHNQVQRLCRNQFESECAMVDSVARLWFKAISEINEYSRYYVPICLFQSFGEWSGANHLLPSIKPIIFWFLLVPAMAAMVFCHLKNLLLVFLSFNVSPLAVQVCQDEIVYVHIIGCIHQIIIGDTGSYSVSITVTAITR